MRKALMLVAFSLLLAGCSESNIQKAQEVAELVKKNCHIAVNIADVAAALSVANPAITGVAAMARAICSQAQRSDAAFIVPVHHEWAQVTEPMEPAPKPVPPEEDVTPEPLPGHPPPLEEGEKADDCVAVINGVCIRKEEK